MKRILEIVAKEIRDALPFAIVDNGTWADGTERKRSLLSKLVCYKSVDAALKDNRKVIKIKDGLYQTISINTNDTGTIIEGSGQHQRGKKGTVIDGQTYGIDIQTYHNIISNLCVTNHRQGGTEPAIRVGTPSAQYARNMLERIHVKNPAGNGIEQPWGSSLIIKYCTIYNAWGSTPQGYGIKINAANDIGGRSSNGNMAIGNYINSNGSTLGDKGIAMQGALSPNPWTSRGNIISMNYTTGVTYAGLLFTNQDSSVQICNTTEDGSYGHLVDVSNGSSRIPMVFGTSRNISITHYFNQASLPQTGDNVSI